MKRQTLLIPVGLLIVALAGFILIIGAIDSQTAGPGSQAVTPATTPTPSPFYPPTLVVAPTATYLPATHTPIVSPTPQPTATPVPALTTPYPPVVNNWHTLRSIKTGFSLTYPANWFIIERLLEPLSIFQPVVTISNYDLTKVPVGEAIYPRGVIATISNFASAFPTVGLPFLVGPQRLTARQFITEGPGSSTSFARNITIYFKAGTRNWVISGEFGSPVDAADKNMSFFYRIVGSLRYSAP